MFSSVAESVAPTCRKGVSNNWPIASHRIYTSCRTILLSTLDMVLKRRLVKKKKAIHSHSSSSGLDDRITSRRYYCFGEKLFFEKQFERERKQPEPFIAKG